MQSNLLPPSTDKVEEMTFEPIKGYPMLLWQGKRPFVIEVKANYEMDGRCCAGQEILCRANAQEQWQTVQDGGAYRG